MTPDEYTAALAVLGWKQADFCRRLDVDPHTPSRWVTGRTAIPRWVPEYLRAMLALQRLHAEFVEVRRDPAGGPKSADGDDAQPMQKRGSGAVVQELLQEPPAAES